VAAAVSEPSSRDGLVDTLPHTVSVRVSSSEGPFQAGSAEVLASASITEGGDWFTGSDLRTIQIVLA
jgi:hypothetical protein